MPDDDEYGSNGGCLLDEVLDSDSSFPRLSEDADKVLDSDSSFPRLSDSVFVAKRSSMDSERRLSSCFRKSLTMIWKSSIDSTCFAGPSFAERLAVGIAKSWLRFCAFDDISSCRMEGSARTDAL